MFADDNWWIYDPVKYSYVKRKDGRMEHFRSGKCHYIKTKSHKCFQRRCNRDCSEISWTGKYCMKHLYFEPVRNYELYDICQCSGCNDVRFKEYPSDYFTKNILNMHCARCKCCFCVCVAYMTEIGYAADPCVPSYVNSCQKCLACLDTANYQPYNNDIAELNEYELKHCTDFNQLYLHRNRIFFGQFFQSWDNSDDVDKSYGFALSDTVMIQNVTLIHDCLMELDRFYSKIYWHPEISSFSFEAAKINLVEIDQYFMEHPFLDVYTCADLLKLHHTEIPERMKVVDK